MEDLLTSHFSQCSMTCKTKAMICAILSAGWVHIKYPLLLIKKSSPHSGGSRFPISVQCIIK